MYAFANPTVYIDLNGNAAYLASAKEFDEIGQQLYNEGNKVGAIAAAVGGAFYKLGTGFFSLGLFDEANQAITDEDTLKGAAKQFGKQQVDKARDVAVELVEEGVINATVTVAGKFACGRARQACNVVSDAVKQIGKKLDTNVSDLVSRKQRKPKGQPALTSESKQGAIDQEKDDEITLFRSQPKTETGIITGGAFGRARGDNLFQANKKRKKLQRGVNSSNQETRVNKLQRAQASGDSSPFISTTSDRKFAEDRAKKSEKEFGTKFEVVEIKGPRSKTLDFEKEFDELGGRTSKKRFKDKEQSEFGIPDLFIPPKGKGKSKSGFEVIDRNDI